MIQWVNNERGVNVYVLMQSYVEDEYQQYYENTSDHNEEKEDIKSAQ